MNTASRCVPSVSVTSAYCYWRPYTAASVSRPAAKHIYKVWASLLILRCLPDFLPRFFYWRKDAKLDRMTHMSTVRAFVCRSVGSGASGCKPKINFVWLSLRSVSSFKTLVSRQLDGWPHTCRHYALTSLHAIRRNRFFQRRRFRLLRHISL